MSQPVDVHEFAAQHFLLGFDGDIVAQGRVSPPPRVDGCTMSHQHVEHDSAHGGEMHPDGDELLYIVHGSITVLLDDGTTETAVRVDRGSACVVPRGVWHRLLVHAPTDLIHVTPGPDFKIRR